jgi:hypothetical protein
MTSEGHLLESQRGRLDTGVPRRQAHFPGETLRWEPTQVSHSKRPEEVWRASPHFHLGVELPGQACTKQDWLRSWSSRQLPPGSGGRSSSRRWKVRPRPQLWLQPLQPDQGASTQFTAGDRWAGAQRGLKAGAGLLGIFPAQLAHTTAVLI